MTLLLTGILLLVLSACGQAQEPDPGVVESSDPALAAEAATLLEGLAERSGLPLLEPVRVERRSREELETFLVDQLDAELPPEEAERLRDAYALLGMVPADLDLRGLLLEVYSEQVAGFYDPAQATLFVMSDQPEETTQTVLVHELVHAVQDQATDLDSITARERGNDRQLAAQAAIEGHATLVMFEYLMNAQGMELDLAQLPDFAGTIRPLLEAMQNEFPALAAAPPVFREALLFPYLGGATFVQTVWQATSAEGARSAPFGELLPQSTEQILEPERFLSEPRDAPTYVELTFPGGEPVLFANGLGALETGIFLRTVAGAGAESARSGWDGDRYALLDVDGERALAWFTVWDDPASRDHFEAVVAGAVDGLPRPARIRAIEVDGRPGALLLVGGAPAPDIALTGGQP